MKQNKHREELQNRRISPSSGAWEKLEDALETHDKKKQKVGVRYLKIASIALILISASYYYLSFENELEQTPTLAAPSIQKEIDPPTETNSVIPSELANTNKKAPIKKSDPNVENDLAVKHPDNQSLDTLNRVNSPTDDVIEVTINDSIIGLIEIADISLPKKVLIDEEVDQLLKEANIKLKVSGQLTSNRMVSSQDLLNSVEEDLYMDLKQKLIEKIKTKLKIRRK